MLINQQNQYCENNYSTKSDLKIQFDPNKNPMASFKEIRNKTSKYSYGSSPNMK